MENTTIIHEEVQSFRPFSLNLYCGYFYFKCLSVLAEIVLAKLVGYSTCKIKP